MLRMLWLGELKKARDSLADAQIALEQLESQRIGEPLLRRAIIDEVQWIFCEVGMFIDDARDFLAD